MFAINIENLKTLKYHTFKKTSGLYVVCSKCGDGYKKMFKEEESIEILNFLGLVTGTEEHQKMYNHAWRRHESRI